MPEELPAVWERDVSPGFDWSKLSLGLGLISLGCFGLAVLSFASVTVGEVLSRADKAPAVLIFAVWVALPVSLLTALGAVVAGARHWHGSRRALARVGVFFGGISLLLGGSVAVYVIDTLSKISQKASG